MNEGKFKKRAQKLQDQIPMGMLEDLMLSYSPTHPNGVYIKGSICSWVDEAKKELEEMLNKPILRDGSPSKIILVTRWFKKWFGEGK